jgi:hypothetical protein
MSAISIIDLLQLQRSLQQVPLVTLNVTRFRMIVTAS